MTTNVLEMTIRATQLSGLPRWPLFVLCRTFSGLQMRLSGRQWNCYTKAMICIDFSVCHVVLTKLLILLALIVLVYIALLKFGILQYHFVQNSKQRIMWSFLPKEDASMGISCRKKGLNLKTAV
jgi:hypothetical protein